MDVKDPAVTLNITAISNTLDAARNQVFDYDVLNRLTDATGIYGDRDYSYDANGNRLTDVQDGSVKTYSYATADPAAPSHHLLQTQNGGTVNYSYDENGNTTSNTDNTFVYGDNNRLKEAQVSGVPLASYVYNGRGERVKKSGAAVTYYHYDPAGQLLAELDGSGTTRVEYVYLDGMPLALISNGNVYAIHTDHLGTPQVITDNAQAVVWAADYRPFGEATMTTELVTNNLRFPGQYYDGETNLFYNWHRYYDPQLGRYITSDPIGLDGGMNTYLYANADPIMNFDLYGLRDTSGLTKNLAKQGLKKIGLGSLFGPVGTGIGIGLFLGDLVLPPEQKALDESQPTIPPVDLDFDFPDEECGDDFDDRCRRVHELLQSLWKNLSLNGDSRPGLTLALRIAFNDAVDQYNKACHPPHPKFPHRFDTF